MANYLLVKHHSLSFSLVSSVGNNKFIYIINSPCYYQSCASSSTGACVNKSLLENRAPSLVKSLEAAHYLLGSTALISKIILVNRYYEHNCVKQTYRYFEKHQQCLGTNLYLVVFFKIPVCQFNCIILW